MVYNYTEEKRGSVRKQETSQQRNINNTQYDKLNIIRNKMRYFEVLHLIVRRIYN